MGCKEIYLMITIFLLSGLFYSCSEDIVEFSPETTQRSRTSQELAQTSFIEDDVKNESNVKLGRKRNNPFTVTNINIAKTKIYGSTMPNKQLTHKYVKFNPTTQEHLDILEDWEMNEDVSLFDFPLEYEILSDGEDYIDPGVSDSLYTYQYSAIPTSVPFPQVPYDEIDDLYLDKSNPILIATSFWFTGNGDDINSYVLGGGLTIDDLALFPLDGLDGLIIPDKPDYPCPMGFEWKLVLDDTGFADDVPVYFWECQVEIPPPPPVLNDCGCELPSNRRYPAGCVRVEADFGEMKAVKIASVKVKDKWFGSNKTYTDENGCWRVNKRHSGNVWIWVRFKNDYVKSKDTRHWFGFRSIHDYVGRKQAPPYNNINVNYSSGATNVSSTARKYWAAAHTLNTVWEHRVACASDGIPVPKKDLNWINHGGEGAAAAPMLQWNFFSAWPSYLIAIIPGGGFLLALTVPYHPDIINQYGLGESAQSFIGTAFHELGHASHYSIVGESYWVDYRNHIINNGGYGEFGTFHPLDHPCKVALGEAVGNYVGAIYGSTFAGGEDLGFSSSDNFIPYGLMWDLEDNIPDIVTDPNTGESVTDNISGFTREMIFDGLNGGLPLQEVQSIRAFRDNLRTLHLSNTSNTASDFNTLVDGYDVFN